MSDQRKVIKRIKFEVNCCSVSNLNVYGMAISKIETRDPIKRRCPTLDVHNLGASTESLTMLDNVR